jgi:serine protease Do
MVFAVLLYSSFERSDAEAMPAGAPPAPAQLQAQTSASVASSNGERYYSDTFMPLRDDVRAYERDPANRYTYCIRNVGTYECLSYGSDGTIRRQLHTATAHGTGFAYQMDGDKTRILTNEHVVSWPSVTDDGHHVDDVPAGCKLINQQLSIVDNEDDEYTEDDIPLTLVIEDHALDAAVVLAPGQLRLMPYRIGHSSALSTGDVVIVRGFPLGVFQAYNTGKVINVYDRDVEKGWDHNDFIIDASLSSGNSGSPVLALNRKTGEYELVGVFHASYTRANALNAVISIDQLYDLMFQLKASSRSKMPIGSEQLSEAEQRNQLRKALADKDFLPYVALGPLMVRAHAVGESFLFEVFSNRFPLEDQRVVFLLDGTISEGKGELRRVYFGNARGYKVYEPSGLDSETAAGLNRVLKRLYGLASATLRYRQVISHTADSRQAVDQRTALHRAMNRQAAQDPDLAQQLLDLASKQAPLAATQMLPLTEVLAQTLPKPAPVPLPIPAAAPIVPAIVPAVAPGPTVPAVKTPTVTLAKKSTP